MGAITVTAPANEQTLMDTDLNALANTYSNVGAVVIDNTTNRYREAVFELVLASVDLSAQTNPACALYLVPTYDGTNYADTGTDASATLPPSIYLVAEMGVNATLAAHLAVAEEVYIGPFKYKPVLVNGTGVALAATLNTLKIKTYTPTVA